MKQKLLSIFLLCTLLVGTAYAQSRTISGRVTSADDGSSLPGVSVLVQGTNTGTQTDANGNYSLTVPENANSLVFRFIGFINQTVNLGASNTVNVTLVSEASELTEVVVTGYGTQKRTEFTGAASSVKGSEIANRPIQSFGQGLSGQAAGVSIVQPNGLLNNPPVIRVRGLSSISLSSFPLVVIDGIPITTGDVSENAAANNPLGDINPSDIESIDILKDAASAAIYGSRAAAGVIVITTKRGREGAARVSYDGWFGVNNAVRLPTLLNAQQYMDFKNGAIANALEVNPTLPASSYPREGAFFPLLDANGNLYDTNWFDEVYRTAYSQNHNLTVSGGTPKTKYYFSVAVTDQDGFLKANDFQRKSGRFNIDHEVTSWLKLHSNINYTNSINASPNSGSVPGGSFNSSGLGRIAFAQIPNVPARNADGSYYLSGSAIGNGNNKLTASFANPLPLIELDRNSSTTNRLFANLGADVSLVEGLTFSTNYSWDNRNTENQRFWNPIQGDGYGSNGSAYNNSAHASNWNWINTLKYDAVFNEMHNLTLLVGSDAQSRRTTNWGGQRSNIADDFFTQYQGTFLTNTAGGNALSEIAYEAYLASVSYNYAGKYLINGNFRRDGNSALSTNNRWGNFGGVSVGWTVSEEDFFLGSSLSETISTMRFKGSWGRVGNGNLNNFYGAYNTYGAGIYGDVTSFAYNQAGNNELKWETSTQTNIGLDLGLFQNRLNLEVNWYNKDIDNLILAVPQTPSKGVPDNSILMNVGSMYSKGWEFAINATPVVSDNFRWNANLNFSTNQNKVTALVDDNTPILGYTGDLELASITKVGHAPSSIYAVKTDGINPENGRRVFINAKGEKVQYLHQGGANAWTYLDGSKASSVASDAQILGGTIPTWFGGFNNNFQYKNFDLGLNFTFSGGNYIYNGSKAGLRDYRIWNNSADVLNAWTPSNKNTDIPIAIYGDNVSNGSAFAIEENVEKGDFLRLQNASLGYRLPATSFGRTGINNIRVYASVNNAFIITNYTGVDPEISSNGGSNISSGVERNSIPQGRSFTFGINVGF